MSEEEVDGSNISESCTQDQAGKLMAKTKVISGQRHGRFLVGKP